MKLEEFKDSLSLDVPPQDLSGAVQALWHVANNNWDRAHELAQNQDDGVGAWVHAHLHRVEGDLGNAGYWYRRADRPECAASLEAEWDDIAADILPGSE